MTVAHWRAPARSTRSWPRTDAAAPALASAEGAPSTDRPILTVTEDTAGGIHDTLMAACDIYRYQELGHEGYHDNCTDNLASGLRALGLAPPETPSPFNLFMNIPWGRDGALEFAAPPQPVPGGYVRLRAEMDLVIAFSACPQDILPINGKAARTVEAHFTIGG